MASMQRDLSDFHEINSAHSTSCGANGVHSTNGVHNVSNSSDPEDLDVLVVGAGFAGCYLLYQLRKRGFKTRIVEAGSDLGGI